MDPDNAKVIADFLLTNLEQEVNLTRGVFSALSGKQLEYKPDEKSKSALGLLRHLTLEDEWILNAVADGRFGPVPDDSDTCGIMTGDDAVACYCERIPKAIARVRALSGEELTRNIDFFGTMIPAVAILSVMLRHSVHHRGQLSTYLRPMGSKVPAIYGPSADTQAAVT